MEYPRLILFVLLSAFTVGAGFSQATSSGTHLTIGVYMKPGNYKEIEKDQVTKLETRIISVINTGGATFNVSASRIEPDTSAFQDPGMMETMARGVVCFPKFEIYDTRVADTGIKKLTVVDAVLTISVQYIHEDIIFSSTSLTLQGSGRNKYQAINDIIRGIRPQSREWTSLLRESREKIISYYDNQCDAIIAKAVQLDNLDSPWNAVQILWPIPQDVACYERVKDLTVDIYRRAINQLCKQHMISAKTALAENNYPLGLSYLRRIDPKSECYEDMLAMIDQITKEVDEVSIQNRAEELQLEKLRLEIEAERASKSYGRMESTTANNNARMIKESIFISDGNN